MGVFQFIYGIFMGTSVDFVHAKRPIDSCEFKILSDNLHLQIGGAMNSAVIISEDKALLINSSMGTAADKLKEFAEATLGTEVSHVICTNNLPDCQEGLELYNYLDVYLPEPLEFSNDPNLQSHKYNIVTNDTKIEFGKLKLLIRPIKNTLNKNDLIVYYDDYCFWGELFCNQTHPYIFKHSNLNHWIENIEKALNSHDRHIPGEGEPASPGDLEDFYNYLKDISNPDIDYSKLRQKYGKWREIVGLTSLSQNYDKLHLKK